MSSQKRKRKPLPKRPCPCCGEILSEKTIERHQAGPHVPTHIKVTHATGVLSGDLNGDLSGELSGDLPNSSNSPSMHIEEPALECCTGPVSFNVDQNTINNHRTNQRAWVEDCDDEDELEKIAKPVHNTWSGRRSRVDEYESDPEDEDFDEDHFPPETKARDSDSDVNSEFEWEGGGMRNGLGMDDLVDEDFQRIIAEFVEELSEEDLDMLRTFSLKVEDHLSDETWAKLMHMYHRHNIPSYKVTKARVEFLAAYRPVAYDCCINSCICYVGPHESKTHCPYCKQARKNSAGRPRKTFTYSPIIPHLKAFFKNREMIKRMGYRGSFVSEDDIIKDIFDSANYTRLKKEYVTIGGVPQAHKFFSDDRDIALGLSLDGFCPFKRRNQTCWPLILFNYNLPPDIRFHLGNILCAGVIPGPQKPKDTDSFAYPLIMELLEFLAGIATFDIDQNELFALHAYLVAVFGDIPAISMIMRMKGHNTIFPCRMCMIKGVRVPDTRNTTHYVPLYQANHPVVLVASGANVEIPTYDAANLPLRTHEQFLRQARNVQFAPTAAEEQRRAKACGIKGIPILSHLPSLSFPSSFPFNFMHLIWENLIPNLVLLWTGKFKGLDEGRESYKLGPGVWEAIGEATKASGSTVPAAYANARPHNIAEDSSASTANSWSFWALYLGPVLLKGRFSKDIYYKHFVKLIKLLRLCLQFEITKDELSEIREGFQDWVKTFERIYYQNSPDRLSTCPVTIHALLHIADGIEAMGPVWAYWAFPMERFCGKLLRCIKSRRHPFANIDSYVTAVAQLTQIQNRYNAHDQLALLPPREGNSHEFAFDEYPTSRLCFPRQQNPTIPDGLRSKIIATLTTRYDTTRAIINRHFSVQNVEFWGKFHRLGGGDIMRAARVGHSLAEDKRDASYVRYELYVDKFANQRRKKSEFELKTFYGQIQQIILIHMPATQELRRNKPETVILASIKNLPIERHNDLDLHYYRNEDGYTELVDITAIQCLVARVFDRGWWTVIDRSGNLACAEAFQE